MIKVFVTYFNYTVNRINLNEKMQFVENKNDLLQIIHNFLCGLLTARFVCFNIDMLGIMTKIRNIFRIAFSSSVLHNKRKRNANGNHN